MKKNLFPLAFLMIFGLYAPAAFSQFNPFTNSFTKMPGDEPAAPVPASDLISYASLAGIPCTPNAFWAIGGTSVDLFTLSGSVITKAGSPTRIVTRNIGVSHNRCIR